MIIVKLIGGLGNQMFQYAVGRHLAIKNNCRLKLDIRGFEKYTLRSYDLHHFTIEGHIASREDLDRIEKPMRERLRHPVLSIKHRQYNMKPVIPIKEQSLDYNSEILSLSDNVYLIGSWQSEKYFKNIKDIIRQDFMVKNPPDSLNKKFLQQIQNTESVSIHVRRGDYVNNPNTKQVHDVCTLDYYLRSIDEIMKRVDSPHFYVFSDDPKWARMNIIADAPMVFVSHNEATKNYEDMRLMSSCKHHIISNSTFSWWGAWLAEETNKIVIAPDKWFNDVDNPKYKININNRIPNEWVRIPVDQRGE